MLSFGSLSCEFIKGLSLEFQSKSDYIRSCLNSLEDKLALKDNLDSSKVITSFSLSKDLLGELSSLAANFELRTSELVRYALVYHYLLDYSAIDCLIDNNKITKIVQLPSFFIKSLKNESIKRKTSSSRIMDYCVSSLLKLTKQ